MPTNLKEICGVRYKIVDDGTDDSDRSERIWCQEIRGKYGAIYPHGFDGSLAVRVDSVRIAMKVQKLNLPRLIRGDFETVFKVYPHDLDKLDKVAQMIKARKKRHLSPDQKAKAVARLQKYRNLPSQ